MTQPPRLNETRYCLRLLLGTTVAIFFAEALVMFVLGGLKLDLAIWQLALLDATMLQICVLPTLYVMIFRPLVEQVQLRIDSENTVQELNQNLETLVLERTDRLQRANEDLLAEVHERARVSLELSTTLAEATAGRERIQTILDSISDGLAVVDLEGRILLSNPALETLFSHSAYQMKGLPLAELLANQIPTEVLEEILGADSDLPPLEITWQKPGPLYGRFLRLRPSGALKWNKQDGSLLIIQDVTGLVEVDRLKTEFISKAAHQLRTPITSVMGFSELLLNDWPHFSDDERRDFLSIIYEKSELLGGLVDDLLDVSRIESGRGLEPAMTECDFGILARDVAEQFQEKHPQRLFEMSFPEDEVLIYGDAERLQQVLENILSNAVKFSSADKVISLRGTLDRDQVRVEISDQGIGMSVEGVSRVFDKFHRGDSTDAAIPGAGLGMTIVKLIVEAHEGQVWVESQPDQGSSIYFTLPLKNDC